MPFILTETEIKIFTQVTFHTVKGYVRKGGCLEGMKKYTEAVDVYKKALEIDPLNNEAKQGYSRCMNVCCSFLSSLKNNL